MRIFYSWTVKELKLKEKIEEEYKYQAMKRIIDLILDGKFTIELNKERIKN